MPDLPFLPLPKEQNTCRIKIAKVIGCQAGAPLGEQLNRIAIAGFLVADKNQRLPTHHLRLGKEVLTFTVFPGQKSIRASFGEQRPERKCTVPCA